MHKRKLLIGLLVVGIMTAGFGAAIYPASADQGTYAVTLLGGQVITVTLDVPPGTPLDQITVPGVSVPIVGIAPVGAPAASTTASTTTAAPPTTAATPAAPGTTTPAVEPATTATPAAPPAPPAAGQGAQKTTGKTVRKARPKTEALGAVEPVTSKHRAASDDKQAEDQAADDDAGAPTADNPTYSFALPGPAAIGVPNFFIDQFRIPPFLLPIYQAAGIQYGVRWQLLAAINEIETNYGRNLHVSTAGAVGWMQFLPSTWAQYGVDANNDGQKDPFNPVDAIFAAARYLKAAGADTDVRKALFSYNHASWYVNSVLLRARVIGGLPSDLVGSLSGLTQGHFPLDAKATYADAAVSTKKVKAGQNAALPVESSTTRTGIDVFAKAGSPAIAVQDGKIVKIGTSDRLGTFIQLRDVYGNTYTYGNLKKLATAYPVPKAQTESKAKIASELKLPKPDPKPTAPASAGTHAVAPATRTTSPKATKKAPTLLGNAKTTKTRLYANPTRPAAYKAGGEDQLLDSGSAPLSKSSTFNSYFTQGFGLKKDDVVLKRLKVGSTVVAGTILGRIGTTSATTSPHLHFEIRPAGKNAPRIDPKPILDGWKLLETTAIYRAAGKNPFFGPDAKNPTIGQVLLMSKEELQTRVLNDAHVKIYACGRRDIEAGAIDQRVLATLEFLSASGLDPTVSYLTCGHSSEATGGDIASHASGDAVDIAAINGIPILNHQGVGSITDLTIRRLLTLQGTLEPDQIISLMTFDGADNTVALPDHAADIHIGFRPLYGTNGKLSQQVADVLKPGQWTKLINVLGHIDNPVVPITPSRYSVAVKKPAKPTSGH